MDILPSLSQQDPFLFCLLLVELADLSSVLLHSPPTPHLCIPFTRCTGTLIFLFLLDSYYWKPTFVFFAQSRFQPPIVLKRIDT